MIIERIKQFFKKLFNINKIKYIEAPKAEENGVDMKYTEGKKDNNRYIY